MDSDCKVKHIDKKKRHAHGFNENSDTQVSRKQRIGFKQYLREITEQLIDDELNALDERDED